MKPVPLKTDGSEPDIGKRLREHRKTRAMSLQDVAASSEISASWLSRIENGLSRVPYDTLKRICNGLGISLEDVIQPQHREFASGRRAVTKLGEAVPFNSDQYAYLAHASDLSHKMLVPLELIVKARSRDDFDHWSSHEGEEFVYVISGAIEVHTQVYEPTRLEAGESAYFDSAMGHVYVSVGKKDARILSVSYDPQRGRGSIRHFLNPDVENMLAAEK